MPIILLSSTVIGIIITGAYSLIQFQKANSLKYITEERKEWRKEISGIMEKIEKSEEKNISGILVQLKVRINAYGLYSEMDYTKDAHIWKLIVEMEKNEATRNKMKLQGIKMNMIGKNQRTNKKNMIKIKNYY